MLSLADGALDGRLRVGIIGPGAMGCLFGALLGGAGHEIGRITSITVRRTIQNGSVA